jgi:hypothetical protein
MSEHIERSLGRVEGQLMTFNEKLDTLLELHRTSDAKHERSDERLSHLERWQSRVIGAYAVLVLLLTVVGVVAKLVH